MTLLIAFSIYFGEYPDLHYKMKESLKRIRLEDFKGQSFLCVETIQALKKLKGKK